MLFKQECVQILFLTMLLLSSNPLFVVTLQTLIIVLCYLDVFLLFDCFDKALGRFLLWFIKCGHTHTLTFECQVQGRCSFLCIRMKMAC